MRTIWRLHHRYSSATRRRTSIWPPQALDEDDSRELVDGRLDDEEEPSAIHEAVVRWVLVLLDAYVRPRGGLVFGSGIKLAVRARSGRLPDVVCYGRGRRPEARGVVRVPPDIVVEVVSSSPRDERRDRIEKPDDYGAFGVR
jgi:Uma2 family endonuclease